MPDQNPNSYLPQSAAPLGQAPLAVIRPPQVNSNIPNPLDITNFYRMQQDNQANLALLQHNQALQQDQKKLELANYQMMVEDSDKLLGTINGAWDSYYGDVKSTRQSGNSQNDPSGGMFGYLDPTNTAQKKVMDKWQGEVNNAHDEMYKLGASYLSSGQKDPGQRLEVARQISRIKDDLYRRMSLDPELKQQTQAAQYYHTMLDQVDALKAKGYAVDLENVAKIEQKYKDYANGTMTTNGVAPAPQKNDFDITKYVYDPTQALTGMAQDSKDLQTGYTISKMVSDGQGGQYEVKETHHLTRDQIINQLYDKYSNDRNAIGYYNNVLKGSTIVDPQTNQERPYTFKDFISTTVSAYTPPEDQITDIGNTVIHPTKGTKGTTTTSGQGPRPDGTWFDTSTDKGKAYNTTAEAISASGFNVGTKDLYNVTMLTDDKERYGLKQEDVIQTDENGNELTIPVMNMYAYQVNDKGQRLYDENGPMLAQKTPVYTFNKRQEPINTQPVIPDATPNQDLGSRNNNPLNLRPSTDERKAGIPIGEGGFRHFDTLQEGIDAAVNDVQNKIDGNSPAMQDSSYMKSKYSPEQLKNYQDVATVEDLINVWSPRAKYGGDNSDTVVDSYIQAIKDSGIDPNTKVSTLGDNQVQQLVLAMMKVESPDSYNRLSSSSSSQSFNYKGRTFTVTKTPSSSGVDWTGQNAQDQPVQPPSQFPPSQSNQYIPQ